MNVWSHRSTLVIALLVPARVYAQAQPAAGPVSEGTVTPAPATSAPSTTPASAAPTPPAPVASTQPAATSPAQQTPLETTLGPFTLRPLLDMRIRGELRGDNALQPPGTPIQYFATTRARVGLEVSESLFRALIQLQDVRTFGQELSSVSNDNLVDLHQGFLELRTRSRAHWVRLGRQEIVLGEARMLGNLDWAMTGRSFDGLRGHATAGPVAIEAFGFVTRWQRKFATQLASTAHPDPATVTSPGDFLAGLSLQGRVGPWLALEGAVLARWDNATESTTALPADGSVTTDPLVTRANQIYAMGLRAHGDPIPGLHYGVEGWFQAGVLSNAASTKQHLAWALASSIGYVHPQGVRPGITVGYDVASGTAPSDGTSRTFNNFFPTNHLYYGFLDYASWQNLHDWRARVQLRPIAELGIEADWHTFMLYDAAGVWNDASTTVSIARQAPMGNTAGPLGHEADLVLTATLFQRFRVALGGGVFIPDTQARARGRDRVSEWAYVMLSYTIDPPPPAPPAPPATR